MVLHGSRQRHGKHTIPLSHPRLTSYIIRFIQLLGHQFGADDRLALFEVTKVTDFNSLDKQIPGSFREVMLVSNAGVSRSRTAILYRSTVAEVESYKVGRLIICG